jgi:alpha-ketoglutarate-dependent taurine dioxygenase
MNENSGEAAQDFARFNFLETSHSLPLVIEPTNLNADAFGWVSKYRALIEQKLLLHGAILFRGFDIHTIEDFRRLINPLIAEAMRHPEMIAGRQEVGEGVYTPTKYPADQQIAPHNEHSASLTFPGRLAFWCQLPAEQGGETPIIDTRKVYNRIDPHIRDKFERLGWMFVRNYQDLPGRRWQTVFQTESRAEVEAYCTENKIHHEWKSENYLRTWRIRPAVMQHPVTRDLSWFNHVTFFHISSLPAQIQRSIRSAYSEEDFPNNTYFGDGSAIDGDTVRALQEAYRLETVSFPWRKGDVLLIDNIMTAHSRNSFSGPRQILLVLANPVTRHDVAFDARTP